MSVAGGSDQRSEVRIAAARAVAIEDELARRGVRLRRAGAELVGPCPACGGTDRFSVNRRMAVWHCRKAGKGGDVIDLVQYLDGCGFLEAVELLAGPEALRRPAPHPGPLPGHSVPGGEREQEENEFRSKEIARARNIWEAAGALPFSPAAAYLARRGVTAVRGAKLRCAAALPRWERAAGAAKGWRVVHEGPALVAAIAGNDGRFQGVQITWIDLGRPPKYRAGIVHPETGEVLAAKIVRGSSKGGHIHLGGPQGTHDDGPRRLVIGEGTETVLSVAEAERSWAGRDDEATVVETAYWASVGLQNMGGRAEATVRHPTLTRTDSLGRVRAQRVPGPKPQLDGEPALMPPDSVVEVITLGDGDSDRFTVEMAHRRAAARWARPGRVVRTAWADDGGDFNSMLRGCAA